MGPNVGSSSMLPSAPLYSRCVAFTLVEVLVVIGILSILAALLFPVFARARASAYKATALSNARQLGAAHLLYSGDYDDVFCPYFSGYDRVSDTYTEPQKYWQDLISSYISTIRGTGDHGQALAEELPRIFFDPIEPFKDQAPTGFRFGVVSSWGVNNNIVEWFAPDGVIPTKLPAVRSQIASPTSCVHLVETFDWLVQKGFPGSALAVNMFQFGGRGAMISVDAPHSASFQKKTADQSADPKGVNISVFSDGHVEQVKAGKLLSDTTIWSREGNGIYP